ncbi:MAG: hypothetical protein ACRD09_12700 [Vicinamibacterales bacterium]
MRRQRFVVGIGLAVVAVSAALPVGAQLPLAAVKSSGQTVTPVFEGWYRNHDGTYSLSFGYFNRNAEEVLQIPIGPDNFVEPGNQNQGQPSEFQPRRHWGVFAVKVPADFGLKEVVWTLKIRGRTFSIPGSLQPNWQIDALEGEAGSGNTPPVLKFKESGQEGGGPLGITAGPLATTIGKPLAVSVWASDDGRTSGSVVSAGKSAEPVTVTWFKHQGPGKVTFSPLSSKVEAAGGQATTSASFSEPGEYVLRVRANDASGVANAGHAQCCWTNGFVKVTVTR